MEEVRRRRTDGSRKKLQKEKKSRVVKKQWDGE